MLMPRITSTILLMLLKSTAIGTDRRNPGCRHRDYLLAVKPSTGIDCRFCPGYKISGSLYSFYRWDYFSDTITSHALYNRMDLKGFGHNSPHPLIFHKTCCFAHPKTFANLGLASNGTHRD